MNANKWLILPNAKQVYVLLSKICFFGKIILLNCLYDLGIAGSCGQGSVMPVYAIILGKVFGMFSDTDYDQVSSFIELLYSYYRYIT